MLFYSPNTQQFNIAFWSLSRIVGLAFLQYSYVGSYSSSRHCFKHSNWSSQCGLPKYIETNIIIK